MYNECTGKCMHVRASTLDVTDLVHRMHRAVCSSLWVFMQAHWISLIPRLLPSIQCVKKPGREPGTVCDKSWGGDY